jgi:small-conductance mechanosensitive channel
MRRALAKAMVSLIGWCIVFLRLVGWPPVYAAEPTKTPAQAVETKPAPAAPVAIPDSEIIPRAEQTVKSLQKLRSEVAADSALSSIEKDFAAFAEKSDRRRESEVEVISKSRSVERLNEIQREWNLEQSQLDAWDQALARRSQTLVAQEKNLDQIIGTWQATQAAVAKKFLFKAVLQRRVEEVLREAQTTRQAIQERMTKLLKLQSQVADRLATLAKSRTEIDQAREEFGRGLFTLDRPPLWQALFGPEVQDTIMTQASDSAGRVLQDLQDFLRTYSERIPLHLMLFLALVAVFYFLRRGLTPEAAQGLGAVSAIFVLDRPFSAALLLALIPSSFFYPVAAVGILRTAIVPTVIPVIRLLPGLLPQMSRQWVCLLAALYVLDFFRYFFPEDWLLTRVLLLLIATGGCVGLGLFLCSPKAKLLGSSSGERLILLLVRFVFVLFAAAIVSNLVGNMTLAQILVAAPVRITYAAALIFAGAHLLMTLTAVALQSRPARWLRSVREHGELLASRCRVIIRLAAVIFWAGVSLYIVGVLGDFLAAGRAFLELRWKVGATEISIEGLAAFLSVLVSAILVSRLLRFIMTEEIFPRIALPRGVPGAVDVLTRYGVMLLGFLIALAAAGVDFSKVTLLISALGVGVGFGLQGVVNNFVSGLILVFEHPVQVGDFVEVGSLFGEVRKIGFRASVVRTPDGADVVIPNGELVGARFINWSLTDRLRRISITVGAAYGTDPKRVIDILLDIARKHPEVLSQPEPLAVFDRFGDSALSFTLLCWSSIDSFFLARSELTIAINNAFKESGIQIPFPQQDVHVHWSDGQGAAAESVARVEAKQWKSDRSPESVSVEASPRKK